MTEQQFAGLQEAPAVLGPLLMERLGAEKRVRVPFNPRDRWLTAAREAYRRALNLYREISNLQGVVRTTVRVGRCHANAGELHRAERVLVDALELAKQSNERISEAGAVVGLGIVAHMSGQSDVASRRYQDAIAIYLELGDLMGAASAHRYLGMHHLRMGAIDEAEAALQ